MESTNTDTPEQSVAGKGEAIASDEATEVESASPNAKRSNNESPMCQPSMLQIFPYLNPRKKVHQTRKCARCPIAQQEDLPTSVVEEQPGGKRTSKDLPTSAGDAIAAAVDEGMHVTHDEVRYEREVLYVQFWLSFLVKHGA